MTTAIKKKGQPSFVVVSKSKPRTRQASRAVSASKPCGKQASKTRQASHRLFKTSLLVGEDRVGADRVE
jgi:hypothetical protein